MSIERLKGERAYHSHTLLDDLQSVFWNLLWQALRYCKHSARFFLRAGDNFFDHFTVTMQGDGQIRFVGGGKKQAALRNPDLHKLPFEAAPLRELISFIASKWRRYYHLSEMLDESDSANVGPMLAELERDLGDPAWLAAQFERAANTKPGARWPKDIVPNQFPQQTKSQAHRMYQKAIQVTNAIDCYEGDEERSAAGVTQIKNQARRLTLQSARKAASKPEPKPAPEPKPNSKLKPKPKPKSASKPKHELRPEPERKGTKRKRGVVAFQDEADDPDRTEGHPKRPRKP